MKKYVFIVALLVPATGAMAQNTNTKIYLLNEDNSSVAYLLSGAGITTGNTGCLATDSQPPGITVPLNTTITITADVGCTGSYSPLSSGGTINLSQPGGGCYNSVCTGTQCSEPTAGACFRPKPPHLSPAKKVAK